MKEWRIIEECYEVSNTGEVRRLGTEYVMKTRIDRYGYEIITLHVRGKALTRKVHRLVALAYVPTDDVSLTVDHVDDDKLNNRPENLQWLTAEANLTKGFETGAHTRGEKRNAGKLVKLTDANVCEIREMIADGLGNSEIGHMFGVTCGCIYSIRAGKSWTHIN